MRKAALNRTEDHKRALRKAQDDLTVKERRAENLRKVFSDPERLRRRNESIRRAFTNPEVIKKIRESMRERIALLGTWFRGGNGMPLTDEIAYFSQLLFPLGYEREVPIKTKGHQTKHNAPSSYKVDFAHLALKIAIEIDGAYHLDTGQKQLDVKKTEVLESLGWVVIRINYTSDNRVEENK